jgi:alcohol dehydrogenase (cytochrome c)
MLRWLHSVNSGESSLQALRNRESTGAPSHFYTVDGSSNLVALNAATGEVLWHANLGKPVTNGAISYELDDRQYLVVGAGDKLFAFVINQ